MIGLGTQKSSSVQNALVLTQFYSSPFQQLLRLHLKMFLPIFQALAQDFSHLNIDSLFKRASS